MLIISQTALADTLFLPSGTQTIAPQAFEGDISITDVEIPVGTMAIGSRAFADCTGLQTITIPGTVKNIAPDAFAGITTPMLISTTSGSIAMEYALANGIDFQAGTKYRALLIGQCAYTSASPLKGPANDIRLMQTILKSSPVTKYSVVAKMNCSVNQIRSAILTTFAGATANDVSLFYYSGHGVSSSTTEYLGALLATNYNASDMTGTDYMITATELRSYLDQIPGRKIVIIDACHSGNMIGRSASQISDEERFNTSFINAFATKTRSNLAASNYYVMTASHSTETSIELGYSNGISIGLFTYNLGLGCGYDLVNGMFIDALSDQNGDGVISFYEAFKYAKAKAKAFNPNQTAQVWPEDCNRFGFIR